MSFYQLLYGDCLKRMKKLKDNSIDMIMADVPYGKTACKWDSIIPLEPMWEHLKRLIKKNGAIVMMASQPFTTTLILSNMKMFKYCWVWVKTKPQRHLLAQKMPLTIHEDILVFYKKQPTYNPQMKQGMSYVVKHGNLSSDGVGLRQGKREGIVSINKGERYPVDVLHFSKKGERVLHPTQKPVALMEYLIKTYTNKDDTVLDFCIGSGTTGIACIHTKRKFIGIEKDKEYFRIAKKRIKKVAMKKRLF